MRHSTTLISIALLSLAAQPALSQEQPRVLFCMGQCFGIDKAGERVPLNKGTVLAPGLRLETGPNSYMQVKLGNDAAFGMGERARVRLESFGNERAALALDQGRVRVLDGEAIGKASLRRVELQTGDGNLVLRGADVEVKTPPPGDAGPTPAPTLVKLNLGDARLGGLPVTKDVVHGIVNGKIARDMPMTDIVLRPRAVASTEPTRLAVPTLPVTDLAVIKLDLTTTSLLPTRSITTLDPTLTAIKDLSTLSTTVVSTTQLQPAVTGGTLQLRAPLETTSGTMTSLKQISNTLLEASKTTSLTTTTSTTLVQQISKELSTTTLSTTNLTPKTFTSPTISSQFLKLP